MKKLIVVCALALSACGTFGTAEYSIKPIISGEQVLCCEVLVKNGKEYSLLKAHIEKDGDKYVVDLEERNVKAFDGQEVTGGVIESVTGGTLGTGLKILP